LEDGKVYGKREGEEGIIICAVCDEGSKMKKQAVS
jgi:hypothetical protein